MAIVLVTGMSGAGKSSALDELARRGHRVVETDVGGWTEEIAIKGTLDHRWHEEKIKALLDDQSGGALFISGCVSNQGRFYPRFDAVVLLSAPPEVLLERVANRTTNDYGKLAAERELIAHHVATVEPLLRASCTTIIDTRAPLLDVVDQLEAIAETAEPTQG